MVQERFLSFPIRGIFNGVSQQPTVIRREGFAESQENGYSSIVEGLRKRPPTEHIKKLKADTGSDTDLNSVHIIDRGSSDQHLVLIEDETLAVYDLDGTAKTVHTPDGTSYLSVGADDPEYRFLTLADVTFVLNPSQTVAMDSSLSPTNSALGSMTGGQALIFLKGSKNSGSYKVTVDGVTVTENDNGDMELDAAHLAASLNAISGITATSSGPTVWLYNDADSDDIVVSSLHTGGDEYIVTIKDEVRELSDLPVYAPEGFIVKISGAPESAIDDYYVKFDMRDSDVLATMGEGQWVETVAPGIEYKLDPATMPHVLFKNTDGSFTFAKADGDFTPAGPSTFAWADREAGDALTNKNPLFVGAKIRDMVFHKNRLGFLTNDNITFSEGGEFFNFYTVSVSDSLATDRINLTINHNDAVNFHSAASFQDDLIMFGDNDQFRVTGTPVLSNDTVQAMLLSSYRSSGEARPVVNANRIFFSFERGDYGGVYQLIPSGTVEGQYSDTEITFHIPRYIPGDIKEMAAFGTENLMCARSSSETGSLFIYKYYAGRDEDVQTSWSKFTFANSNIRGMGFANNSLYMVNRRAGEGWFLEKITFQAKQVDTDADYLTHLDRRLKDSDTTIAYDSATDLTTYTLPYNIGSGVTMQVVTRSTTSVTGGKLLTLSTTPGHNAAGQAELKVQGDHRTTAVWIGEKYTLTYQMSPPRMRDRQGQIIYEGRLQLRRGTIEYADSGFFRIEVTPVNRDAYEYDFTGRVLGAAVLVIGDNPVSSGTFNYPIRCRADDATIKIINDSPLPSTISSVHFEGAYTSRTSRAYTPTTSRI